MEPTNPSDPDTLQQLHSKITMLEQTLEVQEKNLITSATYGKYLLEKNDELRCHIDELMKQHATAFENKEQEICSLQLRLQVTSRSEQWQQEELNNLRTEMQEMQVTITEQVKEEKKLEIATYKEQIANLHQDVDNLQAVEQELRGRLAELDALLQSHLDRTQIHSSSSSFSSEEIAQLTEELTALKMDLTELQARNIDLSGQLQQCQREKDALTKRLKAASLEFEEQKCQLVSSSKHLQELKKEALELRAQLNTAELTRQAHSSKGNSLFSEVEDRRLLLEKMMASLKVQNQQLKQKYEIEKQQNQKYKMEIAMALQMTGRNDDSAVQRLRAQLSEAHAEIRVLIDKTLQLESSKDSIELLIPGSDILEKLEDQNYAEYMEAIIETEKKKAAKAQAELRSKSLQYLDVTNQNVELAQQNKELKAKCNKLQSQLIKATIEKEELQLKYQPDKVKSGSMQKRVVEKLNLGQAQQQMREKIAGVSARSSNSFQAPSTSADQPGSSASSRPSSSTFKPLVLSGQPNQPLASAEKTSNITVDCQKTDFLLQHATPGKENCIDALFQPGRKVSMVDDVKVIYSDGQEDTTLLTGNSEKPAPTDGLKKRKAPTVLSNARHIAADETPQYECKTQ